MQLCFAKFTKVLRDILTFIINLSLVEYSLDFNMSLPESCFPYSFIHGGFILNKRASANFAL